MKKVFLVMLEDGTCVFSRVPGDVNGMRRASNFKKKTKESKIDLGGNATQGGSATT